MVHIKRIELPLRWPESEEVLFCQGQMLAVDPQKMQGPVTRVR